MESLITTFAYILFVLACFAIAHIVGKDRTRGRTKPQPGTWDYIVSKYFEDHD